MFFIHTKQGHVWFFYIEPNVINPDNIRFVTLWKNFSFEVNYSFNLILWD